MFPVLRQNFGTAAAFIFIPMVAMGELFHADAIEILYAAVLMYMTAVVLLMLEDVFPMAASEFAPLYTEEELQEIDEVVAAKRQVIINLHVTSDVQQN